MTNDLDTVGRFSDRAADYVKYRPTYPAAAIDAMLDGLAAPGQLVAADIGAGTGISARLLGDRGVHVVAVEPGEGMRGAAAPHPHVEWMAARAEALGLRSESVDLVLSAQSFHWFRPADALPEFARILKPRRRLVIIWNRRSRTDPLTMGYRQAIADVGGETAEEFHLDDLAFARVFGGKGGESIVESEQGGVVLGAEVGDFVEGDALDGAAALAPHARAGEIDEHAAHHLGGDGEEVNAVLPVEAAEIGEAHVGLMDEGGGLEGMVGALAGHVVAGEAAQFGVDNGRKPIEGGLVSASPCLQQFGDLFR